VDGQVDGNTEMPGHKSARPRDSVRFVRLQWL